MLLEAISSIFDESSENCYMFLVILLNKGIGTAEYSSEILRTQSFNFYMFS